MHTKIQFSDTSIEQKERHVTKQGKTYKIKCLLIFTFSVLLTIDQLFAQKYILAADSIAAEKERIQYIRNKASNFFQKQHKRFANELKGLNREYLVYCTPTYDNNGSLNTFFYLEDYIYKPTRFEVQDSLPFAILEYTRALINRAAGNWCKERFGYNDDAIKYDDEFAILFIYSPKTIPDSLSVCSTDAKIITMDYDEIERSTTDKKRFYLNWQLLANYINLSAGLNERFVRVVLKY
jgi:hypothetical protein